MNGNYSRARVSPTTQLLALAVALITVAILASCGSAPTLETCDDVARATTRGGAESSVSSRGASGAASHRRRYSGAGQWR